MTGRQSQFQLASAICFIGLIAGAGFVAFSSLPAHSADPDTFIWLSYCVGIAALTALVLSVLRAPKSAWLALLLIMSGASQLWLSDGNWFKTIQVAGLGPLGALAYLTILVQAVASLIVLCADKDKWLWRNMVGLKRDNLVRLFVLTSCIGLFSVSIMNFVGTYDPSGYVLQLIVSGCMIAATMTGALAILVASDLGDISVPDMVRTRLDRHAFILIPFVFFVAAILYTAFAFGFVPVVEDETAYLFQAKTIAGGGFSAPELSDAVSDQMAFYLIENDAAGWSATTAAGWPVVLSIGVLIGLPWLVNPILGTLSVVLGMAFWRRVTDRWQAIIVGILMSASPWLLEVSGSLMTHALVLALTLGSWNLIAIAMGRSGIRQVPVSSVLFVAGLLMGWIFFTRALEGFVIGGLTGVCLLWLFGRQRKIAPILAYGMGCIATGSLYFLYNQHMTGDALTTPLMAYLDAAWGEGANAFGFGAGIGPPEGWGALDLWPGHSPVEAIINLNNGLNTLNTELFGWSMGSLILLLVYVIWQRPKGLNAAMAALAAVIILLHVFYWFSGTFYVGPRYWFGAFFAFIVLSANGFETIRQLLRGNGANQFDLRMMVMLLLFSGFSMTVFSTWRGVERYAPRTELARIMSAYQLPDEAPAGAVIALPCQRVFDKAMHLNDPYLRGDSPVYLLSTTAEDMDNIRIAFPDRPVVVATDLPRHCGG